MQELQDFNWFSILGHSTSSNLFMEFKRIPNWKNDMVLIQIQKQDKNIVKPLKKREAKNHLVCDQIGINCPFG